MEAQEQQQQMFLPQYTSGMKPKPPNEDFFSKRIDGGEIIEVLQHQLRGEVEVKGVYRPLLTPLANEEGINRILNIVYAEGLNKNIFLGNLTHEQINIRCQGLWKELARLMTFKNDYEKWGVKKENRRILIKNIVHQIHSALSRSEEGKEADQLSTAAQRHEIYHEGLEQKKTSTLNPLGWMRGGK